MRSHSVSNIHFLTRQGGYNLNVSIGTPPQSLALLVDAQATGIHVLYPGADSMACSEERYCSFYGQFDPRGSSSFASEEEDWRESRPESFTGLDTLTLGDSKVTNVSLGLVTVDGISSCGSHLCHFALVGNPLVRTDIAQTAPLASAHTTPASFTSSSTAA
jgi:hypothetical protein